MKKKGTGSRRNSPPTVDAAADNKTSATPTVRSTRPSTTTARAPAAGSNGIGHKKSQPKLDSKPETRSTTASPKPDIKPEIRRRADSPSSKAPSAGGQAKVPSRAPTPSSLGRKTGQAPARTPALRPSSPASTGTIKASSTSPTRPGTGTGRVQAMAAMFSNGQDKDKPSPAAKPVSKPRKQQVAPAQSTPTVKRVTDEAKLDDLTSTNEQLRRRLTELENLLEDTRHQAQLQEAELGDAVLQRDVLSSVRDELMKQLREQKPSDDPDSSRSSELQKVLDDTTQRLEATKQELDTLREELASTVRQRDNQTKTCQELSLAKKQIEEREQEVLRRQDVLQKQLDDVRQDLSTVTSQREDQERNFKQVSQELKKVEVREQDALRRNEILEKQLEELKKQLREGKDEDAKKAMDIVEEKDSEIARLEECVLLTQASLLAVPMNQLTTFNI